MFELIFNLKANHFQSTMWDSSFNEDDPIK